MDIIKAHEFSQNHRKSMLKSNLCGCFSCLKIFSPAEIVEWRDVDETGEGQTAVCPKCDMPSLIGDVDVDFTRDFLERMNELWF